MNDTPMLEFRADWSFGQSAPLVAGGLVVVRYYRARLAGQVELDRGEDLRWALSGFCSLNTSLLQCFQIGGRSSDEVAEQALALPEAGTLALWFERSNRYGERYFDSNYGRNFCFTVLPSASGSEVQGQVPFQVHGTTPQGGSTTRASEAVSGP